MKFNKQIHIFTAEIIAKVAKIASFLSKLFKNINK